MAGLWAFAALLIGASFLKRRAFSGLSDEERSRLVDAFSRRNRWLRLLLIVGGTFGLIQVQKHVQLPYEQAIAGTFGTLMLYSVARGLSIQRRLAELEMPAGYRRQFMFVQLLTLTAFLAAIVGLVA